MIRRFLGCGIALPVWLSLLGCLPVAAQEDEDSDQVAGQVEVIRQIGTDYVRAFNSKDAKKLASYWSPNAVYTNRLTGERISGRGAIERQFSAMFADSEDLKIEVAVQSIDLLSPNVAMEKGVTTVLAPRPDAIPYSAVYVKRDGSWLLDRVTDDPEPVTLSHEEELKPLEWLVGTWGDGEGSGTASAQCSWTKNRNFLTRSFTYNPPGQSPLSGLQIIGWDAGEKRIRSWTFDSDGGFAQGAWSRQGDQWYVVKKGKTADGRAVSAVNVISVENETTFKLKSVQRTLDGQLLPNLGAVTMIRQ